MSRPFLSIVIPAHNEEESIRKTVEALVRHVKLTDYEVLVCNDHSTDNTFEIAKSLEKKHRQVRALSNNGKNGFGNVIRFGFRQAKGKYVLPVMADLCDDPRTINKMVEKAKKGFDVVVGSRYISGGGKRHVNSKFKSMCSWAVGRICWSILKIETHDSTNAFKMVRKSLIDKITLTSAGFDISLELTIKLHRLNAKFTEVPTVWTDRSKGESKFRIVAASRRYIRWLMR